MSSRQLSILSLDTKHEAVDWASLWNRSNAQQLYLFFFFVNLGANWRKSACASIWLEIKEITSGARDVFLVKPFHFFTVRWLRVDKLSTVATELWIAVELLAISLVATQPGQSEVWEVASPCGLFRRITNNKCRWDVWSFTGCCKAYLHTYNGHCYYQIVNTWVTKISLITAWRHWNK